MSAHTDPKNVEAGESTFIEGLFPVCLEGPRKKPLSHIICLSSNFRPVHCIGLAVKAAVTVGNKAGFNESSPGVTHSRRRFTCKLLLGSWCIVFYLAQIDKRTHYGISCSCVPLFPYFSLRNYSVGG